MTPTIQLISFLKNPLPKAKKIFLITEEFIDHITQPFKAVYVLKVCTARAKANSVASLVNPGIKTTTKKEETNEV